MSVLVDAFEVVTQQLTASAGANVASISAPTGKKAIGGGVKVASNLFGLITVLSSYPSTDGSAWNFTVTNSDGSSHTVDLYATFVG